MSSACVLLLSGCDAVDDALDPDCTAESAARNVAMQSAIGVGNRCGPGETVRDMAGTIREWAGESDFDGDPERRVLRGGTWNVGPNFCRPAARFHNLASFVDTRYGFRLVVRPQSDED